MELRGTTRIVHSLRLAGILMSKGMPLIAMYKENGSEDKNVFLFKNTPRLEQEIEAYRNRNKAAK